MKVVADNTASALSATPIADAFESRVINRNDYCAAYGEAIEQMAKLERERRWLVDAIKVEAESIGGLTRWHALLRKVGEAP